MVGTTGKQVLKAMEEEKKIDLSLLHPDMAEKLKVYRNVWTQYEADIEKDCECLVSGCILDGECCEDAFDLFNTVGDCIVEMGEGMEVEK